MRPKRVYLVPWLFLSPLPSSGSSFPPAAAGAAPKHQDQQGSGPSTEPWVPRFLFPLSPPAQGWKLLPATLCASVVPCSLFCSLTPVQTQSPILSSLRGNTLYGFCFPDWTLVHQPKDFRLGPVDHGEPPR